MRAAQNRTDSQQSCRAVAVSVRSREKFGEPLRHRRGSEARRNEINGLQSRECERAVAQAIFSRLLRQRTKESSPHVAA